MVDAHQIVLTRNKITKDGKIDRNGPRAILVSRESATCRYIDTDRSATFPIDETHSDMVKFTRNSHYYDVVIDKLSHILQIMGEVKSTTDDAQNTCVYGKSKPSMEAGASPSHPPTTEGSLEPSIPNITGTPIPGVCSKLPLGIN